MSYERVYEYLFFGHIANLPLRDGSRTEFKKLWKRVNKVYDFEVKRQRRCAKLVELNVLKHQMECFPDKAKVNLRVLELEREKVLGGKP
jgi:hypothetical protein